MFVGQRTFKQSCIVLMFIELSMVFVGSIGAMKSSGAPHDFFKLKITETIRELDATIKHAITIVDSGDESALFVNVEKIKEKLFVISLCAESFGWQAECVSAVVARIVHFLNFDGCARIQKLQKLMTLFEMKNNLLWAFSQEKVAYTETFEELDRDIAKYKEQYGNVKEFAPIFEGYEHKRESALRKDNEAFEKEKGALEKRLSSLKDEILRHKHERKPVDHEKKVLGYKDQIIAFKKKREWEKKVGGQSLSFRQQLLEAETEQFNKEHGALLEKQKNAREELNAWCKSRQKMAHYTKLLVPLAWKTRESLIITSKECFRHDSELLKNFLLLYHAPRKEATFGDTISTYSPFSWLSRTLYAYIGQGSAIIETPLVTLEACGDALHPSLSDFEGKVDGWMREFILTLHGVDTGMTALAWLRAIPGSALLVRGVAQLAKNKECRACVGKIAPEVSNMMHKAAKILERIEEVSTLDEGDLWEMLQSMEGGVIEQLLKLVLMLARGNPSIIEQYVNPVAHEVLLLLIDQIARGTSAVGALRASTMAYTWSLYVKALKFEDAKMLLSYMHTENEKLYLTNTSGSGAIDCLLNPRQVDGSQDDLMRVASRACGDFCKRYRDLTFDRSKLSGDCKRQLKKQVVHDSWHEYESTRNSVKGDQRMKVLDCFAFHWAQQRVRKEMLSKLEKFYINNLKEQQREEHAQRQQAYTQAIKEFVWFDHESCLFATSSVLLLALLSDNKAKLLRRVPEVAYNGVWNVIGVSSLVSYVAVALYSSFCNRLSNERLRVAKTCEDAAFKGKDGTLKGLLQDSKCTKKAIEVVPFSKGKEMIRASSAVACVSTFMFCSWKAIAAAKHRFA